MEDLDRVVYIAAELHCTKIACTHLNGSVVATFSLRNVYYEERPPATEPCHKSIIQSKLEMPSLEVPPTAL